MFDIEEAVQIDTRIQRIRQSTNDVDDSIPKSTTALNRSIVDIAHYKEFVGIEQSELLATSSARLETNKRLLSGAAIKENQRYSASELLRHKNEVLEDLKSARPATPLRMKILSRLIRSDYEFKTIEKSHRLEYHQLLKSGDLPLESVDFSEINYLTLADYLILAYWQTNDIYFGEKALDVVYKPYNNLRDQSSRWRYNKLINSYINILIEGNINSRNYDEALYYISLNKSRMLLEERLAFSIDHRNSAGTKMVDFAGNDGIPRSTAGLPDKSWYRQQLASAAPYLDFYVGGQYVAQRQGKQNVTKNDRSTMPLNTRDFGIEDVGLQSDTFVDDALYITQIGSGKVLSLRKVTGAPLSTLKQQLNISYQLISRNDSDVRPTAFLQQLKTENHIPPEITISPDKWVSRHPLDFHLNTKVTRSVNFFTARKDSRLSDLRVTGFFNPTLDLEGAEQEADAIRANIPSAQIFKREAAQLTALRSATASIIHLSMHGQFNSEDPKSSRLAFAGASRSSGFTNDPNSLYARDMYRYDALKERELIFAAACQTGLSAADQANANELMGILRPLTANRNKNIILSLWKVDDAATKDFVTAFYQHLASSKDVSSSFHYAQDRIRRVYQHPYYWAAFYLAQTQ